MLSYLHDPCDVPQFKARLSNRHADPPASATERLRKLQGLLGSQLGLKELLETDDLLERLDTETPQASDPLHELFDEPSAPEHGTTFTANSSDAMADDGFPWRLTDFLPGATIESVLETARLDISASRGGNSVRSDDVISSLLGALSATFRHTPPFIVEELLAVLLRGGSPRTQSSGQLLRSGGKRP